MNITKSMKEDRDAFHPSIKLTKDEGIRLKVLAAMRQTTVQRLVADAVREHVLKQAETQQE